MLFPADTKLKIRFKDKNMFCENTARMHIATIHPRLLYTISRMLYTCYRFLEPWVWKASWSTAALKNAILQSPLSLICRTNLWMESVSGMNGAWWILSGSTISSDLAMYTVTIDGENFIVASEHSLGVWTIIWPDFTFRKMTFLMVVPMSSIKTLPWYSSL